MEIAPGVRAIQIPEENIMRPVYTNIYLVGETSVIMVDTGEDNERFKRAISDYLTGLPPVAGRKVTDAVVTHSHYDHSGGLRWVRDNLGAKIWAHPKALPILEEHLGKGTVEPLKDGQVLAGEKATLEVIYTPGHNPDSVCYYTKEQGVLFTGDTILGVGTVTISDLYDYMDSLRRLLGLENLRFICPGHGPVVEHPREKIQEYIDHRNMRENQILTALKWWGPQTSWELVLRIYWDVDPRLHRPAEGNVLTHLRKLEREGRVRVRKEWEKPVYQLA